MGIKFVNNSEAQLAAGISDSATALTLKAGQGAYFPTVVLASGDYFYCTLIDISGNREVIKVTEHQSGTDVFQLIERAADGIKNAAATANAYTTNDKCQARINALILEEWEAGLSLAHIQHTDTGTTQETFQIESGGPGPKLKNDSGTLQFRNAADDAYANLVALALTLSGTLTGVTGTFSGTVTAEQLTSTDDADITGTLTVGDIASGAIVASASSSIPIDNEATDDTIVARDHGTETTPEVVNVIYSTGTPPAASSTPIGTLFVKYTA
jgi:hypothetical protein